MSTRGRCKGMGVTGKPKTTHGMTHTTEYAIWSGMKSRCFNPNSTYYSRYGGRGISVCERWLVFENFIADMGKRPSSKHSIDRKDNNGNYEPGNCRWATMTEQNRNQSTSVRLSALGESMTYADWEDRTGIGRDIIWKRVNESNWTPDDSVSVPVKTRKHQRTLDDVARARALIAVGVSDRAIGREIGVNSSTVRRIRLGHR